MFGLLAPEVSALKARGYRPAYYYETNPELREAIDLISHGFFSRGDANLFRPLRRWPHELGSVPGVRGFPGVLGVPGGA